MNPIYMLDTNVISEHAKEHPNVSVMKNLKKYAGLCAICSTVWQKSVYSYEKMPERKRKEYLWEYLQKIKSLYAILPYDDFAAQICGELRARCRNSGKSAPNYDSQIAATAIANGMILVTHNTADYAALRENSMLKIEDWWE